MAENDWNSEAAIRKRIEEKYSSYTDEDAQAEGFDSAWDLIEQMIEDELNPENVLARPPGSGPIDEYELDGEPAEPGPLVEGSDGGASILGLSVPQFVMALVLVTCAAVIASFLLGGGDDGPDPAAIESSDQERTDDAEDRVDEEPDSTDEVRTDDPDPANDEATDAETGDATDTGNDDAQPDADVPLPSWIDLGGLVPSFLTFSDGNQVGAVAIDRADDSVVVWFVPANFGLDNLHFQSRTGELVQAGPEGLGTDVANGEVVQGQPFHTCADGSTLWLSILEGGRIAVIGGPFETPFVDLDTTDASALIDGAEGSGITLDGIDFDAFGPCEPAISIGAILVTQFEF